MGAGEAPLATHPPERARSTERLLGTLPEVVSVWTLTGKADHLLRVWYVDLEALNQLIHERFLPHLAVSRVQSQIVMNQLKGFAGLPL